MAVLGEAPEVEHQAVEKHDNVNTIKIRESVSSKEDEETFELTAEHRGYLIRRHGTTDLDPVPFATNADPYNWPQHKKVINLVLVAFHAFMSTFNGASLIAGYEEIAAEFETSIARVTYLTSLQIAISGTAPLLLRPLCNRYGRRPVLLASMLAGFVCNVGAAKSYSYGSLAVCQALIAFTVSPAVAIGSAVVAESFFKKERARYMGIWTLFVTLGIPFSPFIFGFVVFHAGFRWIFWTLAIIHAVELLLYSFFGPETRYLGPEREEDGSSPFKAQYLRLRRIDPTPFTLTEIFHPLSYFLKPCVLIPAAATAMILLVANILLTVETPQLYGEKFHLNAQQLGLQFLSTIIGSVIGEQAGGPLSDWWMNRQTRKLGRRPAPEYRLWLSYPGSVLAMVGVVIYLVQIDRAAPLRWNITPDIGFAIASVGNQLVTTVFVTYAVDCYYQDAASIGAFAAFLRLLWGFIGPFWFPYMFQNVGLKGSAGIGVGCIMAVSVVPVVLLQIRGHRWR